MKKFLFFILFISFFIVTLPFIGNSVVESTLNDRIEVLDSYGVKLESFSSVRSYFHTKNHYQFIIQDSDKFMLYLAIIMGRQIDSNFKNLFLGTSFGMDISYSNFPLSDDVGLDLYLVSLSKNYMADMKQKDFAFYTYFKNFLEKKGFFWHLEYNILGNNFNGYFKDIQFKYQFIDGSKLLVQLRNSKYVGTGFVLSPDVFSSKAEMLAASINTPKEKVSLSINNVDSSITFDTNETYISNMQIGTFNLDIQDKQGNDVNFSMNGFALGISQMNENNRTKIYLKNSLENTNIISQNNSVKLENFSYDAAIENIDTENLKRLQILLADAQKYTKDELNGLVLQNLIALFSKGIELNVAQFSLENIVQNSRDNLGGFEVRFHLLLEEDELLKTKIYHSPMEIEKEITLELNLRISKLVFDALFEKLPAVNILKLYGKNLQDDVVLEIKIRDSVLSINGQRLQ